MAESKWQVLVARINQTGTGRRRFSIPRLSDRKEYHAALKYIVEQTHTVVAATTDENGEPVICAIDIYDTEGFYFLTAKKAEERSAWWELFYKLPEWGSQKEGIA